MHEKNRAELEKNNALHYHNLGYDGKGINIATLDVGTNYHDKFVKGVLDELAPGAEKQIFTKGTYESKVDEILKGNFDIVNVSMPYDQKQLDRLADSGLIVVQSAGNDNKKISNSRKSENTIIVGAIKESTMRKASYSNYGEGLDVMAFTNIYVPNASGYYVAPSGTSFAAPVISGLLACYLSYTKKKMNAQDARELLQTYSVDVEAKGFDDRTAFGYFKLPNIHNIRFKHNPTDNNRITYNFGFSKAYGKEFHGGTDFGAIKPGVSGDNIYSVDDGVVLFVKENSPTAGNYCIIGYKDYFARYCHLEIMPTNIIQGANVKAGDIIALMGNTGKSTSPHLHLEIKVGDYKDFWERDIYNRYINAIDPALCLKEEGMSNEIEQVSDWAKIAWEKAKTKIGKDGKAINDGKGAKNPVTEEQLMVFFDRLGLLD